MKGILVGMCLVTMGLGVGLGFFAPASYSGKETFRTEQEYTLFKEAISSPDVRIQNLQSLSSGPPIIVTFAITTPIGEVFPYGQKNNLAQPAGHALSLGGFGVLCWTLFFYPKQVED